MTTTTKKTSAKTTAAATDIVEDTLAAAEQSVGTALKAAEDVAAQSVDQLMAVSKDYYAQGSKAVLQGYEDATAFNKANFDATLKTMGVITKGVEDTNRALFALSQALFEKRVATYKAVMGAKTLKEVVDLETEYVKGMIDGFVTEGTKLSESSIKVANDAIAPLNERVNAAVEKIGKAA